MNTTLQVEGTVFPERSGVAQLCLMGLAEHPRNTLSTSAMQRSHSPPGPVWSSWDVELRRGSEDE